jgi:hypothetical protein
MLCRRAGDIPAWCVRACMHACPLTLYRVIVFGAVDYMSAWFNASRVKGMAESGFFLNVSNVMGEYVYGPQMQVCARVIMLA